MTAQFRPETSMAIPFDRMYSYRHQSQRARMRAYSVSGPSTHGVPKYAWSHRATK